METQNNEHFGVINPDTTREELLAMINDPNITTLKINMTPEEWSHMLIQMNVQMITLNKECIMEEQHAEIINQSLEERRAQYRAQMRELAAQLEAAGIYQPNSLGFTEYPFMAVISM